MSQPLSEISTDKLIEEIISRTGGLHELQKRIREALLKDLGAENKPVMKEGEAG